MSWGEPGPGRWVTIYANPGHVYMVIDGRRFDTTGRAETGSRWQWRSRDASGYTARHPPGLLGRVCALRHRPDGGARHKQDAAPRGIAPTLGMPGEAK